MSFLLSPAAEAKALRQARGEEIMVSHKCSALICNNPSLASKAFKWLIVPMLNPDGVVRGCYRCGGSLGFVYLFVWGNLLEQVPTEPWPWFVPSGLAGTDLNRPLGCK